MAGSVIESTKEATLRRLAAERILVLDGAKGTMIQALSLDEEGYRGARFDAWNREVRGNNDLLVEAQRLDHGSHGAVEHEDALGRETAQRRFFGRLDR